jgi:hypothetical protein
MNRPKGFTSDLLFCVFWDGPHVSHAWAWDLDSACMSLKKGFWSAFFEEG